MNIALLRQPLLYQVPGMTQADIQRNITYKRAEDIDLQLDVYCPHELTEETRLPGMLFIHGGPIPRNIPLRPTEWGIYQGYGALMAASGFIGITINHRYFNLPYLEQSASDIQDAIDYLRTNAAHFNLDPDRLGLWVFSGAGPHLSPFLLAPRPYIRCLVAYYATLDLRHSKFISQFLPDHLTEYFSPAAIIHQAPADVPPVFIVRADLDKALINQSIDLFVQAAQATKLPLKVVNHPQGQHGFDVEDDVPSTHQIIGQTMAFIQEML